MKQHKDFSQKPYYRCLICPRFRMICGGRPTRDMDLPELCEYLGDVMEYFGHSIPYVAKEARVSEKTVERIKYRKVTQDFMRGTIRMVEQVVLGHVGEHTCHLDHNDSAAAEQIRELQAKVEHLLQENQRYAKFIDKYLG